MKSQKNIAKKFRCSYLLSRSGF